MIFLLKSNIMKMLLKFLVTYFNEKSNILKRLLRIKIY